MAEKGAIKHVRSSGNVFADAGLPDEYLAKAELVSRIDDILSERNLTQREAARLLGIDQPRVSALLRGKLDVFSLEKLLKMLRLLGNKVEIVVTPEREGPSIAVAVSAPRTAVFPSPIHPGEILREEFLSTLGMSARELAVALRVPARRINEIVNERRGITADTALRLSRHFGTTARFWMNLQASWELEVAEDQLGEAVRRDVLPRRA